VHLCRTLRMSPPRTFFGKAISARYVFRWNSFIHAPGQPENVCDERNESNECITLSMNTGFPLVSTKPSRSCTGDQEGPRSACDTCERQRPAPRRVQRVCRAAVSLKYLLCFSACTTRRNSSICKRYHIFCVEVCSCLCAHLL
jgi:hypothetical protein